VWPGHLPAGVRVATTVSLRDVGATILDLAQVSNQGEIPGRSLAWSWTNGRAPQPAIAFSAVSKLRGEPALSTTKGDMYSVVVDSFHLIRNGDGVEELYQIHADPMEATDLITSAPPELVRSLRAELNRFRGATPTTPH
jgi:arylsulfatase A-like enzyme